jgi:phosphatidylserine/phosphatidylglycerophosphate/cardiolipin synthase-like enzyme
MVIKFEQKKTARHWLMALLMVALLSLAACAPEDGFATQAPVEDNTNNTPTETSNNTNNTNNATTTSGDVRLISLEQGNGAEKGWWQVYFTAPTGERNRALWVNGVDTVVGAFIDEAQSTLDVAAFELNNEVITEALINAHNRGVQVRVVTDDDHGVDDDDSTLIELEAEGIEIVDDDRSGLMHNKFIVRDGLHVFMGSMNMTMNGVYRNNNNFLILRSRNAAETYTSEFEEMFIDKSFGITSDESNSRSFNQDGTPVQIMYGAEDDVVTTLTDIINGAQSRIRFMAFAYTLDELGEAMENRAAAGVDVRGVFETTGSGTEYSEFTRLYCAGMDVRRDGNVGILHHKVIIVDDTVITGSFNFSGNASRSNDENLIIITDADLAELYIQEFERVQAIATRPDEWDC